MATSAQRHGLRLATMLGTASLSAVVAGLVFGGLAVGGLNRLRLGLILLASAALAATLRVLTATSSREATLWTAVAIIVVIGCLLVGIEFGGR